MKSKAAALALLAGLVATNAAAQGDSLGVDEVAEAIVKMTTPVWTGPRTPIPSTERRPTGASVAIRSDVALVTIHAPPTTDPVTVRRALRTLEYVRGTLDVMGWPDPLPDGNLGGGPEFDLYFAPAALPTEAHADDVAPWSFLDRASTFATVSPMTPHRDLDACITMAYAEALLLSMDPAEAKTWRRATAAWITWVLTGRFGCIDAVEEQQAEPFRSWVSGAAAEGAGGSLLLAFLSARHDARGPAFVRDAWYLASQRTWEGEGLRAEPDLWAAIETSIERSGDSLLQNIQDLAVQRWFVGRGETQSTVIAAVDSDARVPIMQTLRRLPTRAVGRIPLEPFGSAYALLLKDAWSAEDRLRVWLKGEYGVRWSLEAVQLDSDRNEIQSVSAPSTENTPTAYVPIELSATAEAVLLVVTNLSSRLPDADAPDANVRAFEVIIARATD